jgi:hypothetical protein
MICLSLAVVGLPGFRDKCHLDLPPNFGYIPSCYATLKIRKEHSVLYGEDSVCMGCYVLEWVEHSDVQKECAFIMKV